jgi:hypothetical protein
MRFGLSHRWVCPEEFQSPQELDRDPVQGVLRSRGMRSQAGTVVTMLTGEIVAFSVESWEKDGPFPPDGIARLERSDLTLRAPVSSRRVFVLNAPIRRLR